MSVVAQMDIQKMLQSQLCLLCSVDVCYRNKKPLSTTISAIIPMGKHHLMVPMTMSRQLEYVFTEKEEFLVRDFVYYFRK